MLTAGPGWPWVFHVNVPIGVVIAVVLAVLLPARTPAPADRPRLDVLGAVLVTAAGASLIYGLTAAGERGRLSPLTGWLAAAAAVGYTLFVLWQRRARSPLMDVRLLARRPVAVGAFLILMATALMIAVFFLGTFYFQQALGYGALRAGLLFLPVALATMLGANLTGRLLGRWGGRALAVAGLTVAAAGMAVPAVSTNVVSVVAGVAAAAAGTGALFVIASATALGQVAPHEAGIASGIVSTFHEFGASVGAAVMSSVAAASLAGTTLSGFTSGFVVAAVASAAGAVAAALVTTGRRRTA
ncbi:MFS transporter [Nonomuraea sp. WAC 01424]|uniref:MFS transporter n=1 Tax=Nonomuraea sp. WAC 01424 TaxID=2203200 RepID=UPI0021ADEEE1|nr:MFS transporter [Nonomuraea sp. WAC 01424]